MEATDDEQPEDGSSESQETTVRAKLRDLRPEKDPIGAGKNTPQAPTPNSDRG